MAESERLAEKCLRGESLQTLFDYVSKCTAVEDIAQAVKSLHGVMTNAKIRKSNVYGSQLAAYFQLLDQLLRCGDMKLQVFALRLALDMMKTTGSLAQLRPIVQAIMLVENWSDSLAACLMDDFAVQYLDARVEILRVLEMVADRVNMKDFDGVPVTGQKRKRSSLDIGSLSREDVAARVFAVIKKVTPPARLANVEGVKFDDSPCLVPRAADDRVRDARAYRSLYQSAYTRLLQLPMNSELVMEMLHFIPANVFPFLGEPLILANFYITAFDQGSLAVSVLSLSGLFYLLTKGQLGDPEAVNSGTSAFYDRLFELLKPEVFRLKYRTRFLRLLHISLKSTMLPSSHVAAFAKKCARLAVLVQSPTASMWLLVNTYTLMQRHQVVCEPLMHRGPTEAMQFDADPFEPTAPLRTAALQVLKTSLWEIELLKNHYSPNVAQLARLFDTDFFKKSARRIDHEDFLDISFEKMFTQELQLGKKKWETRVPSVAFQVFEDKAANDVADLAFTSPF